MEKVLLTTVFTGYNYGSCLQALAGKIILEKHGYECMLVGRKSLMKGRDVRFGKLFTILYRSIILKGRTKSLNTYQRSFNKRLIGNSVKRFNEFEHLYLKPTYMSWYGLKKLAKVCKACFAGSDQIWNSSTLYVDPLYYLRFAPHNKRIAFSPSFGRDFIADYNKDKILHWVSEFSAISVREDSGIPLIKSLTGREVTQIVDPTLLIEGETWRHILRLKKSEDKYILAYFLDKPSLKALDVIKELKSQLNCEVIGIPYIFDNMNYCDRVVPTGPIDFLNLIDNASVVLTDSFHGTAFSINLHTPFYVFGREYGTAHSQNSRVDSILQKMGMTGRFEPLSAATDLQKINFSFSDIVLESERKKASKYLINAIKKTEQ